MKHPPEIWRKEITRLIRRRDQLEDHEELVAFYGSSSIRLWVNMKNDLDPLNTLNLGFGGSTYEWCLHYFEELFTPIAPHRIVLYSGENDLSQGTTPENVLLHFQRLFDLCKRTYSGIKISVISVKPSVSRTDLIPRIQEVNRLIKRHLKNEENADFIDVYSEMLDDNGRAIPGLYLSDGLHLNKAGYKIWKSVLRNHFDLD